jgi:hypothetical protein
MRAPADSYWSIDECRWVHHTAGSIEIPDQRAVARPESQDEDAVPAAVASGDDLHP